VKFVLAVDECIDRIHRESDIEIDVDVHFGGTTVILGIS
jgi:hypothetical protein